MRQIVVAILLTAWASLSQQAAAQAPQSDVPSPAQKAGTQAKPAIIVPAGTRVALALTSPIWARSANVGDAIHATTRSEEHTSELQSQSNLVCRLLLEKKKSASH